MAICPSCKTDQARRKAGCCPNCGAEVEIHGGRWYQAGLGSPTVAILEWFENRVTTKLRQSGPEATVFTIPRKGARWQRELVAAGRCLDSADGDYDLVLEALELLFSHKRFSWKNIHTMMYVDADFTVALAMAKAARAQREAEEQRTGAVVGRLLQKEDIFA